MTQEQLQAIFNRALSDSLSSDDLMRKDCLRDLANSAAFIMALRGYNHPASIEGLFDDLLITAPDARKQGHP